MNKNNLKYSNKSTNRVIFRLLGITTIFSVYLLILIGGVVRSTGAGMGCPDWPKCFGQWVPPTEANQLPENYKDVYAEKRKVKNLKLAQMIEGLGFPQLAAKIRGDAATYIEDDFNATKTWIEYINRLVGVLIGFFIFLTLVFSFSYRKINYKIPLYSFLAFVLVGIQGWIGSIVVSTNLLPGMITVHMLLAIVIVMLLIYAVSRAYQSSAIRLPQQQQKTLNGLIILVSIITVSQVVLGTQVREAVDTVAKLLGAEGRASWIESSGVVFYIHRSFSWLVLLSNAYLIYYIFKKIGSKVNNLIKQLALTLGVVVLIETFSGIGMAYFGMPAFLQPIHLLLAVVVLGILFTIWQLTNMSQQLIEVNESQEASVGA